MTNPKYKIGDTIVYKDSYWGNQQGVIETIGTQGSKIVYGVALDKDHHTICKENEIKKIIIN